ncbi:MAG TPA: iron chelate uptake ABC transporter family permease subunit [Chlamydiales bacterium]|jgi:manganese/zinc/iron transport system permease protein|nr:iron chelate uptake ABC transporter family permease subunit [Chlamydiales bacterium]
MNLLDYFTDPIVRAPALGCILMCTTASLMGVVLFFQRRLMISESISHAAYPGGVAGVILLSLLGPAFEEYSFLAVLFGALLSSWLGLKAISWLERCGKVKSDAALTFALSSFFGFGILLASWLQESQPMWISQTQILLFGQAATLTDMHVFIYGVLSVIAISLIAILFRPIQAVLFDRAFSKSVGIQTRTIERLIFWLLLFSIVAGIRSVGVILMSGMLIAPAVAARQFSNRLKTVFFLAALFGAMSGWLGNVLSVEIALRYPSIHLPTGPMIVLVGTAFALFGMLFSPKRGVLFRILRVGAFRLRCLEENILKEIWKKKAVHRSELRRSFSFSLHFVLLRLIWQGWVKGEGGKLALTNDGLIKAASIVRLHRLWELYLTQQLGIQAQRVHRNAEEMEHILTPELERRLTYLLSDPKHDPHHQPIPEKGGL